MKLQIAACSIVFVVAISGPAHAQSPEGAINAAVKDGERVRITAEGGREFRGRIVAHGPHGLTVANRSERADVPYEQITRIDRQADSLLNGTLIGLGIGVGLGVIAELNENAYSHDPFCGMGFFDDCSDDSSGRYLVFWSASGMLIGAGIDALIHRPRTIYRRAGDARVVFAPTVGRSGAGAGLSIRW